MKTSDLLLVILFIALILGMLLTALFGRGSRHGYGMGSAGDKATFVVENRRHTSINNLTSAV